jgi:hypothetical protein
VDLLADEDAGTITYIIKSKKRQTLN